MESGLLLDNVFGAIVMTKQVKSKQRVVNHGEVFTATREVNAMLNLVEQETERVEFLPLRRVVRILIHHHQAGL